MKLKIAMILALLATLLNACGGSSDSGVTAPPPPPAVSRSFKMGFTPWPYEATVQAVNFVNTEIEARGDFVAQHLDGGIPWPEALAGTAYNAAVEAEIDGRLNATPANKRAYLAISPFNGGRDSLAGYWNNGTNEALPAPWDTYDFDSPEVITAYTSFARDMITRFQPDYFNFGIEASELILNDLPRFNRFLTFSQQVSASLRNDFPNVKLMVSVALKTPGSAEMTLIETHMPGLVAEVDVVGVSTYPYIFFSHADKGDPTNLPADWLSQVQSIANGKPVAIAETAWAAERVEIPTFGVDVAVTAANQAAYATSLFAEAEALDAEFVVWWALVDFDPLWNNSLGQDPVARIWRDTGLFDENLNQRLALDIWQQQLAIPLD